MSTQDENSQNDLTEKKPPDWLFAITIQPTFNVAQRGINLDWDSQFTPIFGAVHITDDFLYKADDSRLQQLLISEVTALVKDLQKEVRDKFGPELIAHMSEAVIIARRETRKRNGQVNPGLQEKDNNEGVQAEEQDLS